MAWLLKRDRAGLLEATPYQEAPDPPLTPDQRQQCARELHVLTADGQWLRGGRACLFLASRIGAPPWLMRLLEHPPFVWGVEWAYRLVAGNRIAFSRILFRDPE